jgi:hypothetical protein
MRIARTKLGPAYRPIMARILVLRDVESRKVGLRGERLHLL